nr:hypothetical protein GCM10025730_11920 [Promicromonospora thailandica]
MVGVRGAVVDRDQVGHARLQDAAQRAARHAEAREDHAGRGQRDARLDRAVRVGARLLRHDATHSA